MGKRKAVTLSTGRAPRVRKPKAPPTVSFVACFHENPRAGLKCSCVFPDKCDGAKLITCTGIYSSGSSATECTCEACPSDVAEHVNGCQGCENCLASVCTGCGKRDPSVPAVEGESWTCSPECTRKTFTVAS